MALTLDEIRREGLDAVRRRLGLAGMIRFLLQFERGEGDYSKSRHDWVDRVSLEDLRKISSVAQSRKKHRKRSP